MTEVPVAVPVRRGRPLTPMQRALWSSQRRHPDAPVQNMALLTRFAEPVDPDRLAAAFERVVEATDVLRTQIVEEAGTPTVRLTAGAVPSEVITIALDQLEPWARERAATPIDVTSRAYDSVVLRHGDGSVSWYLALHHVVTDATSSAMVFAATAAAYETGVALAPPSYYEWADRLDVAAGPRADQAIARWRDRPAAPGIGHLYRRPRRPIATAERLLLPLAPDVVEALEARLASDYRMVSPDLAWTTLLVTLAALQLHRVTGVEEFSVGIPVHNRGDAAARAVIGPVMEVFPVDVTIDPADTFRTLHRRVARSVMTTLRSAVAGTAPRGDYEVLVNVIPRAGLGRFGTVPATTEWIHSGSIDSAHLFHLQLTGYGDAPFQLVLDVNHGGAGTEHRRRSEAHLRRLLDALVADPDAAIASVDLVTAEEAAALAAWEQAPDPGGPDGTVVGALRAALGDLHSIVLEDGTEHWTGAALWTRVLDVAAWVRDAGAGPGRRVGVELVRSADAVIAILATLVAGASYVPLDPGQPFARRRRLAERAGCVLVIDDLPEPRAVEHEDTGRWAPPEPGDEAYLLFTSGSTGEPKGVPITHLGLARYLHFAVESYTTPRQPPVAPLFSALTFDLTVTSLFVPLLTGGRIVVIRDDGLAGLSAIAGRSDLTWIKATPSHLEILERLLPPGHAMATMVVGGEAFSAALARRWFRRRADLRIFNEYGPTEAVVGCMIHEASPAALEAETDVPIGRPAPGVTLQVVDRGLRRVPIGSPGELVIASPGLTAGYLDDERSDAFVELEGQRFYRSGDLVRFSDDETLVYLGRIDEQVKVGGIRLEPTEVEAALETHPAVGRAAVRLWTPRPAAGAAQCSRCGLPSDVPGTHLDAAGVCSTCHEFERMVPVVAGWFRTVDDLVAQRDRARVRRTGEFDCIVLLSGGVDSTFALYRLVELGFEPFALTVDHGFLSDAAIESVRRTVADLGISHEFVRNAALPSILADSLQRFSSPCFGCTKAISILAERRAVELRAPFVVSAASRGQLFETRLATMATAGEFDPDAVDRAFERARLDDRRGEDATRRLAPPTDDPVTEVAVDVLDVARYIDLARDDVLAFLAERAPWAAAVGPHRSGRCRVNEAGIHTHLVEHGFPKDAVSMAWDVRLGWLDRSEAEEEGRRIPAAGEVESLLDQLGYRPSARAVLTAWLELEPGAIAPGPAELRAFLARTLPAHAIPAAFVVVPALPTTANGKLDARALPAPARAHRSSPGLVVSPVSPVEALVVQTWEEVLRLSPIGMDDDFFNLGGDSLAAVEMIVKLADRLGRPVREDMAFLHATPRALAAAITEAATEGRLVATAPAAPGPLDTPPPFTVGEQSILFDQHLHPGSLRYNVGHLFTVDGTVDGDGFAAALLDVVGRHPALSWTYGVPRRRLAPEQAVTIDVRTDGCASAGLPAVLEAFHRQPFDLGGGPLLRALVQPVADGSTAVLLSIHHVAGDAESFLQLWDQIDAGAVGRPSRVLVTDPAAYEEWLRADRRPEDRDHWRARVAVEPPARLAIAPPPVGTSDGFLRITAPFSPDALKVGAGASAFSVALAALTATLRDYSDGSAIEVGVIASTRVHPAADPLVGYLLNTLPVRLEVAAGTTLRALTTEAAGAVAAVLAHRSYPLAEIVADRRAAGEPAPNVEVLLAFHELRPGRWGRHRVTHEVLFNGEAVADATFFVELHDDRVDLALEYRGRVMGRATAQQLLADFEATISAAVAAPWTAIERVDRPSAGGRRLDGGPLLGTVPVLAAIEDHLARRADAPAVTCGGSSITWGELRQRSDAVVGHMQANGVARGDRVVVGLPRSIDLVVAIVAILRAGASYVPIDPTYPEDRIRLITGLAGATMSLTSGGRLDGAAPAPPLRPAAEIDPDDEAYVIFTSGSTGTPRGVPVSHRQLAASTAARLGVYDRHPGRFLLVSSAAFDSSVAGLFWTLVHGGELVIPTDVEVHDPDALLGLFEQRAVTHTLMVPTLYEALLERGAGLRHWPSVVAVAGEACSARLVRRHHELRPGSSLYNEYGPTEATVWATAHRCGEADDPVPIGEPVPGTWVEVVGPAGHAVPPGVTGELVIGGAGVTAGYLDDPDETMRRFGRSPAGDAWFRTGDRVVLAGGTLHFLGRLDHQLNVGGMRAEPEEIERVLLEDPAVGAAIVTATDPRTLPELLAAAQPHLLRSAMAAAATEADPIAALGDRLREQMPTPLRLAAHLEPAAAATIDLGELAARLASALPAGLRPMLVVHAELPRTPNGKLDRAGAARLPIRPASGAAGAAGPDRARPAPGEAGEPGEFGRLVELVRHEFEVVLGTRGIGTDRSFFDLGGHSLLALELVTRLEPRVGARVNVATLYEAPTPELLARRLQAWGTVTEQYQFLVPIQPLGTKPPIYGIHVLGENASFFRPLAAELGPDQPVFGLGLIDEASSALAPTDVAEACRRYAAELMRNTPEGPVILAAVSVGGAAAMEVARLLVEHGREVSMLALFDAAGPDAEHYAPQGAVRARLHLRLARRDPVGYGRDRLENQWAVVRWRWEQAELRLRQRLARPIPERLRQRVFVEANIASAGELVPYPFAGRVVVFRAGDDPFTELAGAHAMGWGSVFPDVEVITVPGGHLSMLQPPHVTHLAAHLRS